MTNTPEEARQMIESAPDPLDGPSIWERAKGDEGYSLSGNALAKALLIVAEENPSLLDVSAEREGDPSGWAAANNEKLWQATQKRYEGLDEWLGGITGFQYGWAHNIVRYILGAEPTGNPALATIDVKDEGK